MQTIRTLIENASQSGTKNPALLALDGQTVTYEQLLRQLEHTAAQLRRLGIGPSDRVAMVMPNGLEMALFFLSIAAATAAAPLNPAYRRKELAFYLGDLRPKAIILLPDTQPELRELATEMDIPLLEIAPSDGITCSMQLAGATGLPPVGAAAPTGQDTALILHTSGTTSRPKMVPLSQLNLVISAGNIVDTLHLTPQDRCLNIMPHFHIHGLMAGLLAPVGAGASVVCAPRFDAALFLHWLAAFSPTYYTAVPTMHQMILERAPDHQETVEAASLRFIRSSSASLAPAVMAALEKTFGCPVIESYGMTEASHQMASNPLAPGGQKPGTVGRAAGPEVAIMAEDGAALLPQGSVGEIVIRGANVTGGYLDNPEANAKAFTGGWFRTGDQGRFDEDGYLSLTGRLKEIINRGGEKIAPREIDERLLSHPAVRQAVAFAIPDERLGEEVGAAVILNEGQITTEGELQRYVGETLAYFKVPRKILFVGAIPKGPTGKLQRVGLAAQFNLSGGIDRANVPAPSQGVDAEIVAFVAGQWAELLNLADMPYDRPFMELGGDSLQAMRLVNRLNDLLGIELTMVDLFEAPTIAHQAHLVQARILESESE